MKSPFTKVRKTKAKGGGTKKVCLPYAKIKSMSKSERSAVISAKRKAGAAGKYKRSSKSNVTGTSSKNLAILFAKNERVDASPKLPTFRLPTNAPSASAQSSIINKSYRSAISIISSISHGLPYRCTGIIALVKGVIAR